MLMFYSIRIRISFFFNSLQKQKPFPRHQYRFFYKLHIMVGFITPILFFASNKRLRKYTTEEVYPIHQQRNKISLAIKSMKLMERNALSYRSCPSQNLFQKKLVSGTSIYRVKIKANGKDAIIEFQDCLEMPSTSSTT